LRWWRRGIGSGDYLLGIGCSIITPPSSAIIPMVKVDAVVAVPIIRTSVVIGVVYASVVIYRNEH
jgi:hypothetical protein